MRGRSSPTSSAAPAQLTSSMRMPRRSSKASCLRTPRKRSGMACEPSAHERARSALISSTRGPPVHRSSESFANLAAALAKAQAKLVNPEKSLTGTIRSGRSGEADRTFRYAPLSSGLEIVRKTLSEHEIAVIQITAVDHPSRMLNLTTLLAHSSGEWIASYWPVCPIVEIANPHRMGAALTYARRYALFTLVGIAGEDDVDAPDICMPSPVADTLSTILPTTGPPSPRQGRKNDKMHAVRKPANPRILSVDGSAALRDRLLNEIAPLASQDIATAWARNALAAKNTLTAEDAKLVEQTFE